MTPRKILCWFGFHSVEFFSDTNAGRLWMAGQRCINCGKVFMKPLYYPQCPPTPKSKLVAPKPWPAPKIDQAPKIALDPLDWIENGK